MDLLQYGFMQRALLAGAMVGVICPLIGIFIVLRRMSLIGDSLSHIALSGVAAGMMAGVYPMATALAFSVAAAVGIEKLRKSYRQYEDLAIAVMMSAGIGTAVVLIGLSDSINIDLFGYLFGSITTVLRRDMYMVVIIGFIIILFVVLLYKELFHIALDEESARIAGIPVGAINLAFIVLIALTITLSIRIVGILLVSSLMVVPVAAGLQVAGSFRQVAVLSVIFAEVAVLLGIVVSYYLDLASGGTIVLISIVILVITILVKKPACAAGRSRTRPARTWR
jgi:zinc transport system permease protein